MSQNAYKKWNKPNTSGTKSQGGTARTAQGYFHGLQGKGLANPDKYVGDKNLIIYRSLWEYRFCVYCDVSPSILKWSIEPIKVPYYDRVAKLEECAKLKLDPNNPSNWQVKNYNTDFWVEVQKGDSSEKWFIEIKPSHQLKKPIPPAFNASVTEQRRFNNAAKEYLINEGKFAAMNAWTQKNNCKFYVFTEETLARLLGKLWLLPAPTPDQRK
jgi:hypothetical protein